MGVELLPVRLVASERYSLQFPAAYREAKGVEKMPEQIIWGIHAGKYGDADELFRKRKVIAIGWKDLGDLSQWKDRDDYKLAYARVYPGSQKMKIAVSAGQCYRFVWEVQRGDLVVYPTKHSGEAWIGKVAGDYEYSHSVSKEYPNQRKAEWAKAVPRTSFSQGALYEMGSAMSLFQIKNYADEVVAVLEGRPSSPEDEAETISFVTGDIEQQTRDFVLKRLSQVLKGHPLSEFVANLLEAMGYKVRVSAPGPDSGVDIVAHPDDLGFRPPLIKIQVKSAEGSIGDPLVSGLYGKVGDGEFGLLITLGKFTAQARAFAFSKGNLRLVDGDELVELIFQHYDKLDARYKGIIPLKRVYIPEALERKEE